VHDLIRDRIGPDLAVIVRTGPELEDALANNPFTAGHDITRIFFVSFAETPPAGKVRELSSRDYTPEELAFGGNGAYLYIPGPYGRGMLSTGFLEKNLGVRATMRNYHTMARLVAMSRDIIVRKKGN